MQSLETKSSRPRPKSFETETEMRPETFETETETPKNGSRDMSRHRDQVSRLHHWLGHWDFGWWWCCLSRRSFRDGQAIWFKVCVNSSFDGRGQGDPLWSGPDDRTESRKHTKRCQSNSKFEEMALLMSLLSPETKEGRSALGILWIGWLTDLRDWI